MRGERERKVREWFRPGASASRLHAERDGETKTESDVLARVWGIDVCDSCGRTILLGEDVSRFRQGERLVRVCPLCEDRMIAEGHSRAA